MRRALSLVAASFLALALAGTAEARHRHSRSCGHSHGYVSYYSGPSHSHYYAPRPVVVYRPYYRPTYVRYYRPYYHRRPHSHVSLHFSFGR